MATVVFLRAANVGGHNTFRPSAFAKELGTLGAVNVGAAGTFVVPGGASAAAVRQAVRARLPFEGHVFVHPAASLLRLLEDPPGPEPGDGLQRFVSVLERPPRSPPALPVEKPEGMAWEVRVVAVAGPYVLSLRRKGGPRGIYPNEVVEKALGVPATTRGWNTLAAVAKALAAGPTRPAGKAVKAPAADAKPGTKRAAAKRAARRR